MYCIPLIIFLVVLVNTQESWDFYISETGSNTNTGTSSTNPLLDLSTALEKAIEKE